MQDKKINVLFDISIILNHCKEKGSGRSGIFFAAYNILRELLKHPELNIEFYCSDYSLIVPQNILEKEYAIPPRNIVSSYKFFTPLFSKLNYLKQKNRRTDNPKTRTIYSIIKRIIIKILLHILIKTANLSKVETQGNKNILENFDAYFSCVHKIPDFILQNKRIKKYTIIYDLIPLLLPEYFADNKTGTWFNTFVNSLSKDDYYFSISEYTKQDFIKHVPQIDGNKITTILLAAGENFYENKNKENFSQLKQKYNLPKNKRYVLSLCTLEPRKNLIFAVKNFINFINKNHIEDLVFVLGGGHWDSFIDKFEEELGTFEEFKNKIIKIGYVEDEDMATLYSNAEMFVYPSLYEGFGLPPLEAMQCGCPVITSNTTSLPEVIGDAGIMINPKNDEELIQAYEKLYFNENLRAELSQKSLQRAKQFNWKKCGDIIVEEMRKNAEII